MNKKIFVIILSVVLCLSVVGGCFALYTQNDSLDITFGSGEAVTLTLQSVNESGTSVAFDFGGVALNPTTHSASQRIKLNVDTTNTASLAGLNGKLTVSVDGSTLDSQYYTLSGVAVDKNGENSTDHTSNLLSGVTLPLDDLPQYLTLTVALKSGITNSEFKDASNKRVKISVSWELVDWAVEENAYYIVGDFSNWSVNEQAIKLGAGTGDNKAELANYQLTTSMGAFKIVQYTQIVENEKTVWGMEWLKLGWTESGTVAVGDGVEAVENKDDTSNMKVTKNQAYYICVNKDGNAWVQSQSSVVTSND